MTEKNISILLRAAEYSQGIVEKTQKNRKKHQKKHHKMGKRKKPL